MYMFLQYITARVLRTQTHTRLRQLVNTVPHQNKKNKLNLVQQINFPHNRHTYQRQYAQKCSEAASMSR